MLVKAGYFRQDENSTITAQFRVRELISFLDGGEVFCDHHLIKYCKYQTDVIVIGYGSSVYVYVVTSEVANPYSLPSTIKNPLR